MPAINSKGTFQVRVESAVIRMNPHIKDDPKAFNVIFKLATPDGHHAFYDMSYNRKVIANGKNAGATWADVCKNTLLDLGVEDGYLGNLQAAIDKGINAEVVMDYHEWVGKDGVSKRELRAKYLNPPKSTMNLSDVNWDELLSDAPPSPSIKPADDIPMEFADEGGAMNNNSPIPF